MPHNIETVLVLGVGNSLLSDDGFGIHVIEELKSGNHLDERVRMRDGGTLGLSLLPDIEDADHIIVVDAAELKAPPGELQVFEGTDMDAHLSRHKSTVHEVAMVDLLSAARLAGTLPKTQTLVAVQPECLDWGTRPTTPVAASIPSACDLVCGLIERRLVHGLERQLLCHDEHLLLL